MSAAIDIERLVPGGVLPSDHVHRKTNDRTCSRCRWAVPHDEVPLMVWLHGGEDLLIYCDTCLDIPRPTAGGANDN